MPSPRSLGSLALVGLVACRAPSPSPASADTTVTVPPPPAPSPAAPASEIRVDLPAGTVGGVSMDASGPDLMRRLGADAVRETTDSIEGTPRTAYHVRIDGAEVERVGFLARFADPRLRTLEGLGVGSTIGQFGNAYGHTEIDDGEEAQCKGASFFHGRGLRACMDRACEGPECRVTSVEFLTKHDAETGEAAPGAPSAAPAEEPAATDAEGIVHTYYDALDAGQYRAAYALWGDGGRRSGKTFAAFEAGYRQTRSVAVRVGWAGREDAGAGQRYVTVPVVVTAVLTDGREQRFDGTYTLHRTVVDGATDEQRAWRIHSASLKQTK